MEHESVDESKCRRSPFARRGTSLPAARVSIAAAVLLLAAMPAVPAARCAAAEEPAGGGVAAVRALKLTDGTLTSVERSESPTTTTAPAKQGTTNALPPRTVVKLVLRPSARSNVNVEMWLPDPANWNGRLLALGNGGAAGHINSGSMAGPLKDGYAVVTTDMGTAPDENSGVGNPEVWKDFGYRATHRMTVAARQIVRACYGRDPAFAYFNGTSTGGQQALQEAQRYPDDYDGIAAGLPAHCRTPLHAYFLWNDQILTKCPFTRSQQDNVIAAGKEYLANRETPPTAGRMVSDPRCGPADVEAVIALAMRKDPTLTTAHAEALRKLFDGPRRDDTGERIFCGIPLGAGFDGARGNLYLFKWVFGADTKFAGLNFGADIDRYTAALGPVLNAENDDLAPFERHGGKLVMWSGSADSTVPYTATLDYYERVAERMGGMDKVRSFFRYYLVPGMSHGPGPGINKLPAPIDLLIAWREKGVAPDLIRGRRIVDGKTELDMPLFPYPDKTGWDAATSQFTRVPGAHGGVERVAERFRPAAAQ